VATLLPPIQRWGRHLAVHSRNSVSPLEKVTSDGTATCQFG